MYDTSSPGLYAFPAFVVLIALEAWWYAARHRPYPWRDSAASLGVAVGHKLSQLATALALGPVYLFAWDNRIATIPLDSPWSLLALFLGVEFAYYWFHRYSHECRWLWATHAVHHSAPQYALSAAYRLGWTGLLSGNWLFWLPLVVIGFHPGAVLLTLGLNLVYQFWLHTETIGRLGPLEWVLNTPRHHRVHHAVNADYLDRNYGGVVIVFDRLFGTYAEERAEDPCRYGLVKPLVSRNPFRIALHEWLALARDVGRARGWRARLRAAFGRPSELAISS